MKTTLFRTIGLGVLMTLGTITAQDSVYDGLNILSFDGHGMFTNRAYLEKIIAQYHPKTAVEVGSWLGSSARFIAENLPEDGKLYCVDTWLGSSELFKCREWYLENEKRFPILYQQFLSNTVRARLQDKIVPVRMTSTEAAEALNIKVDMIFIDAAHDTDNARKDILAWWSHLKKGGIMCGDDYSWKEIQKAVRQAARILGVRYHGSNNFWWLDTKQE